MVSEGRTEPMPGMASAFAQLEEQSMVERIWKRDHSLWRPDPKEICNRLGWLDCIGPMRDQAGELVAFADEVRDEGYRHVALLGMGGSSLGPEVIRQAFAPPPGYPRLLVLDSTVPAQVRRTASELDPAATLFLVSSKSGGTVETLSLYRFFRGLADEALGRDSGSSFAAITDPGTPLETLGRQASFRRVFLNDPDIGGRYSVLSCFGLVPAALSGVNVSRLLDRSDSMRRRCSVNDPRANPGARLGASIVSAARTGRDKLTLSVPPPLGNLGLWVEQLIAESLGKDGKGIIPIAGEPLLDPGHYGNDRLFVHLAVASHPDPRMDEAIDRLESAGHPVERLELEDVYDLGAEFFRWEFATAVAGSMLEVHPFDQPDVQSSKDLTDELLDSLIAGNRWPEAADPGSVSNLLDQSAPGDYLAIMAYIPSLPETDELLGLLRRRVMESHRLATTVGYGPRFLHSTGQLHKGGPPSGLFLQLTMPHDDLQIPGEPYGFGALAEAQAIGDYRALRNLGRRTARVDLGSDPVAGLRRLLEDLPR